MPKKVKNGLSKKVFKEIDNAYNAHVYINEEKELWISTVKLHVMLRTTKTNARYIIQGIREVDKVEIEEVTFIRLAELATIIFKNIEGERTFKRRSYLEFTDGCIRKIRNDSEILLERMEYLENKDSEIKKLKQRRIKQYGLKVDELTGERLDVKNAQFSHIRSKSLYPELATEIDNGLIVNLNTHALITSLQVSDEDDLLLVCKDNDWDASWYEKFTEKFLQ